MVKVSFELCVDSDDRQLALCADGHHGDSPALRKALVRALSEAYNPGEGLAEMARSASLARGWMGEFRGRLDYGPVESDGTALTVWDDDNDEPAKAKCWWPCTWAFIGPER